MLPLSRLETPSRSSHRTAAADHYHRFAEVGLGIAGRMRERNEHLALTEFAQLNVILHDGVVAGVAVLAAEPFEDALGGVALLLGLSLVLFRDLIDGADPGVQFRAARLHIRQRGSRHSDAVPGVGAVARIGRRRKSCR